jgi:ribulose-5-phosphate 4-epimerase/fuculose-1-phosphate aldolase
VRPGDPRGRLVEVGRAVVRGGLVVASGGNLSARAPGSDECWVTPAGSFLDQLEPEDFLVVRVGDGSTVAVDVGDGSVTARPSTEVALHLATYRVRPDVNAVVHLHPQTAILLDLLGERIRLATTDHAFYLRRVATIPFHPPGTRELAGAAAEAVRDGTNCVLLAHHGCSVLGDTVEMAYRRAVNLEEAARLTYRGLLLTGRAQPAPAAEIPDCPVGWWPDEAVTV